jgi:hypothetical protein
VVVTILELRDGAGDRLAHCSIGSSEKLDRAIPFSRGYHRLRMNSNGVPAVLTGTGASSSGSTVHFFLWLGLLFYDSCPDNFSCWIRRESSRKRDMLSTPLSIPDWVG